MFKPMLLSAFFALNVAPAALAQAHDHGGHGHHAGHQAPARSAPIHQVATSQGVTATFHLETPKSARYTCPMHPEVEAAQPGACPVCKMALAKQTHRLTLTLAEAGTKRPVAGAMVRVTLEDGQGLRQELRLAARTGGTYEGAFHLMPGNQALTARVAGPKPATLATRFIVN